MYSIRVGSDSNLQGGQIYAVKKFTIHPDWDVEKIERDFTVFSVTENIVFGTDVMPIQLANSMSVGNKETGFISGWGISGYNDSDLSPILPEFLQSTPVKFLSNAECAKYDDLLTEYKVCVMGVNESGACSGMIKL